MIIFPLTPEIREAAQRVVEHAEREKNWYAIEADCQLQPPGMNPNHVLHVGDVRAVFSWTKGPDDVVVRHMSVSVSGGRWPHPIMVWTIANMFGFTGADADEAGIVKDKAGTWGVGVNDDEHCIVMFEPVIERTKTDGTKEHEGDEG